MIYQENKEFKIFQYEASWNTSEGTRSQYVNDKSEFERELLEQLKMTDPESSETPILPNITYVDVALTTDEQTRFDQIKKLALTLDQVRDFVINATVPDSDTYRVVELQETLTSVQKENVDLMTMLVEGGVV